MYRLDSTYDRIRLEEAARAQAREYLRDEGIPVWQIDPDELAHRVIARAHLPLVADDPDKAKACYVDQCRLVHAELLRDAIRAHRGGNIEHVRPVRLLLIESPEDLGEIADDYWGEEPDGDLLLYPVVCFNRHDLATALDLGAKVVHGYRFEYPCSVDDDDNLPRGWCGYSTGEGYALQRDVASVIWAASVMRIVRAHNGDLEYVISNYRCICI